MGDLSLEPCAMMTDTQPTIREIVARLQVLTNQLRDTSGGSERRALLRQFRELLDEADKLGRELPATGSEEKSKEKK
jgi:hypothetical protein